MGLGTVQFGMDYGISNQTGQTALEEAKEILETARRSGISIIDTAASYGKSEEVLGLLLPKEHSFRITTKLPGLVPANGGDFDSEEVVRLMEGSLLRLKQRSVYALILHRADDLLTPYGEMIMRGLQKCKRMGFTEKIGVSIYAEDQIEELISRFPIDLIQAPVNLFDQRLIHNGFLKRCKQQGIEVHARSVFLQGLLCMEPLELPSYFLPYAAQINKFRSYISERGISPIGAALSFVNDIPEVDAFVCGVNRQEQLQQLVSLLRQPTKWLDYSQFAATDPAFLNPSQWKIS
ncbi:aldo/keto reductase [Cohnella abietis]|nr:aldo/keto reductase [Cohnella abietis]